LYYSLTLNESSSWGTAPCNSMYFATTSSVTFPVVATKNPPCPKVPTPELLPDHPILLH